VTLPELTIHMLRANGAAEIGGEALEGGYSAGVHASQCLPAPFLIAEHNIQAAASQHTRGLHVA
jgi:hypothetical protein